jgi:hypothetical protein
LDVVHRITVTSKSEIPRGCLHLLFFHLSVSDRSLLKLAIDDNKESALDDVAGREECGKAVAVVSSSNW